MAISYEEIREAVKNSPKFEGTTKIARAPLIHEGFPGQFNVSYSEYHWLKEYGGYVDFNHDLHMSTIQSCIRFNDISYANRDTGWKYLGVFELADVYGAQNFSRKVDENLVYSVHIKHLIDFLEQQGISKRFVYASYCMGGNVTMLTKGKYTFDFNIPEDEVSKSAFLEAGLPKKNLIPDRSRGTLLALHLCRPTPWGYRNEIFFDTGKDSEQRLLDIGTAERLLWKPIYRGSESEAQNIHSLETYTISPFFISAVGLERLCLAVNGLSRVQDVDYIKPFYDMLERKRNSRDYLAGESLRALHRIFSDVEGFKLPKPLSRSRSYKVRVLSRNVVHGLHDISSESLRDLLKVHSESQSWHPELEKGIEPTIERIAFYREAVS